MSMEFEIEPDCAVEGFPAFRKERTGKPVLRAAPERRRNGVSISDKRL